MFTYDYEEIKKKLNSWKVKPQEYLYSLYKSGLLCEINELTEANQILTASLDSLRRQLKSDEKNTHLLSLESATITLLQHLSSAINYFTESQFGEEQDLEQDYYKIRRRIHKDINGDWDEENSRFVNSLYSQYVPLNPKITKKSFDFGRATTTTNMSEDKEMIEAIAFLRFREETGHPFRILNFVDGTKAAVGAADRIVRISVHWAIITLVRAADVKGLDSVITRPLLSSITHEKANAWW